MNEEDEEGVCPNIAVIGRRDVLPRSHDRSFPLSRSCMVQSTSFHVCPSTCLFFFSFFFSLSLSPISFLSLSLFVGSASVHSALLKHFDCLCYCLTADTALRYYATTYCLVPILYPLWSYSDLANAYLHCRHYSNITLPSRQLILPDYYLPTLDSPIVLPRKHNTR
jgi:hypothetical protein